MGRDESGLVRISLDFEGRQLCAFGGEVVLGRIRVVLSEPFRFGQAAGETHAAAGAGNDVVAVADAALTEALELLRVDGFG